MKNLIKWLLNSPTDGPKSILLLRLMAGGVFFWEGILKFVYTNRLGGSPSWGFRFLTSPRPLSDISR